MDLLNVIWDHQKLNYYLNEQELISLHNKLKLNQRAFLLTKKHFIKVGTSSDRIFFNSLLNELNIYQRFNFTTVNAPKLLDCFSNEKYIILILEKIEGHTLGAARNDFKVHPDTNFDHVFNIIKNIGELKPPMKNINILNRDINAEKYLKEIYKALDSETRKNTELLIGNLHQNSELIFSHGDLIPTNIIKSKSSYYIIDWEWASLRPSTYDVALFILFSRYPLYGLSEFEKLDGYWDPIELYRDAIIISAREIKNWLEVKECVSQKRYLKIWLDTLKKAERWLLSYQ